MMLSNSKTYELPLSPDYVRHWGMAEAVRELIQNAIDSDSPFEYEFNNDVLTITSRFASLTPKTLLLGATTKADNKDKIGSHGEGYKIALLVLTREGYPVIVHNGDRTWKPVFRESKKFESQVLCIEDSAAVTKRDGVTFEVSGLSPDDIEAIKDSCLYMQDNIGSLMAVNKGKILRQRPGKLYVGSLFVCNTKLEFGYDINPEFLRLERDRQTVSDFDLKFITKDMWFQTERWDEIAQMLADKVTDLDYAEYGAPEMVKEACYKHFVAKNPGKILVKNQEELNSLIKQGMSEVIISSSAVYTTLTTTSRLYKAEAVPIVAPDSPTDTLKAWFEVNRKHMRRSGIEAFKELLTKSEKWKP